MAALTDDGSRVMGAPPRVHIHRRPGRPAPGPGELTGELSVDATAAFIVRRGARRVALQLPDALLPAAAPLVGALRRVIPMDVLLYILGDTTFAPCCVDEVAAQHAAADLLLHYGPACFSTAAATTATRHVLPLPPLDVPACVAALSEFTATCLAAGLRGVVLLFDSAHYRHLAAVWAAWCGGPVGRDPADGPDPAPGAPTHEDDDWTVHGLSPPAIRSHRGVVLATLHGPGDRKIGGMRYALLDGDHAAGEYGLFTVAEAESPLATPALLHARWLADRHPALPTPPLRVYPSVAEDSDHAPALHRRIRRRAFIVEKVKEAELVGIVVVTLGLQGGNALVERLQRLLTVFGRRHTVVMVGKLNVVKLANLDQVDLFVVVGCPGHTLIDDREFVKPLATPLELVLGLEALAGAAPSPAAMGPLEVDLETLLAHPLLRDPEGARGALREDEDSGGVDISLASGRVVALAPRPTAPSPSSSAAPSTALASRGEWAVIARESPALERLHARQYQGLDADRAPCDEVQRGQAGVARHYASEPSSTPAPLPGD